MISKDPIPRSYEASRQPRAADRTAGAAHGHQREEPLALGAVVDVVGEGPGLGDGHQAEDAHPDEENHAQIRHFQAGQDVEQCQVRHEEGGDAVDQPHPVHPDHERAVEGDHSEQQHGLGRGRVALYFGAAAHQDQRLADGLEQIVGRQQQEEVQHEQQRGTGLALSDLGEQAEQASRPVVGTRPLRCNRHSWLPVGVVVPEATPRLFGMHAAFVSARYGS